LPISCGASHRDNADCGTHLTRSRSSSTISHPTLAIPERTRILLDDARLVGTRLGSDNTDFAYTNHTLLPLGSRKWPLHYFQQAAAATFGDHFRNQSALSDDAATLSRATRSALAASALIEEGPEDKVRMANLGSSARTAPTGRGYSLRIVRTTNDSRNLAEMFFPERFNNTNGVRPRDGCCWEPRRWRSHHRRHRRGLGNGPQSADKLKPLADDKAFATFFQCAASNQGALRPIGFDYVRPRSVDPDAIFDCQITRIHEYKRSFSALRIIVLYRSACEKTRPRHAAANLFLRRKAAPSLSASPKLIIKFIKPRWHDRRRSGDARRLKMCSCPTQRLARGAP